MKKLLAGLVLVSMSALVGFSILQKTDYSTADVNNGKEKYLTYCLSCHGELGHGNGVAAATLSEKPSNIYKKVTSPFEFESELYSTVMNGNEGMPAWGAILSTNDVRDIFGYIIEANNT
ncbi:hypothetical protein BIT28_22580 [Photobacterium proteolyticum]|uniref:Cytochrome c domain-containing protein n=1 Tax=Photobacterium proteolyticum TaxID=1903952 RepID=A0A1Q9GLS0_9GAMM|nr:cytochrome c [Photobacterium proteolyticum]OLQ75427.1 hypothetical protein BIT28_22580 [Photobacterium proteolyticum]